MPEHNVITDPDIHEPKGVASASSGQVYVADGAGSGAWGTAAPSVDQVIVDSESDLPATTLVGGVLTHVLADKEYLFTQDMSIASPLGFPGVGNRATIRCTNRATVTYTGTDAFFRDTDAKGDIEVAGLVEFKAPSGDFFEVAASTGSFSFQSTVGARFTDCNSLGTFNCNGTSGVGFFFGTFSNFDQGLVVTDPNFFEANLMFMFGNNQTGCVYFDISGASTSGSINMLSNTFSNGSNETIWDFDSTIESGVDSINILGNHQEGGINGSVFAAGSLDLDTPKLKSNANNGVVSNSIVDGLLSLTSNATATTISSAGVGVLAAGTWTVERASLMTGTTAGRLTSNHITDITLPFAAVVTIEPSAGTNKIVGAAFALNGTVIANSKVTGSADAGAPINVPLIWQQALSENDYLEVFLFNDTDTTNVLGSNIRFRVN